MMTTTPEFMGGEGTNRHYNDKHRESKPSTWLSHCGDCSGSIIGTITTNIGSPTPRNGFKIIELYEVRDQNGGKAENR